MKATITVSATVTSSGGSASSAALMAADEVTDKEDWNLILFEGPCDNSLTADFLAKTYPACGADSGFTEGEGYVELKDNGDNVAMIVAGWEGDDTKRAAKVVANPSSFELDGKTAIVVTGTTFDLDGITIA